MDERYQVINDALEKIYADIVWIEESELRKSVLVISRLKRCMQ